jgi:hypothetical protein
MFVAQQQLSCWVSDHDTKILLKNSYPWHWWPGKRGRFSIFRVSPQGNRHMPSDEHIILDRIPEFERNFEEHYQRKMTDEEKLILHPAEQIIRQKQRDSHLTPVGALRRKMPDRGLSSDQPAAGQPLHCAFFTASIIL